MEQNTDKRQKALSQLLYSLLLIIFIPAMMIFNIYWTWNSVRNNTDTELRRKAILANELLSSSINRELVSEPEKLQKKLEAIKKKVSELEEVSILVPENENFTILASTNREKVETIAEGYQSDIAWKEEQPTAILASFSSENNDVTRIWSVTNPIFDGKDKIALIDSKVSLADIDELTQTTLRQTLIILISTVLLTLLLLVNHFRFFEAAVLYRKLEEIDKMKDDFISVASHELKTPIAAIRGYLSNLVEMEGMNLNEAAQKSIGIVAGQAARLNDLVNDLLNVSRIEQGRLAFDMQPIKVDTVIKEVFENLSVQANEKALELKYDELPNLPAISADATRLREIFMNIIGNAVKYTLQGSVVVSHEIDSNNLKTIIKDTGVGMSAEARERLFEKFYRIQTDKTSGIPGTGLGLWLTKTMIEKMNGKIYVDSMENVGSQFTIVFPISKNKPIGSEAR